MLTSGAKYREAADKVWELAKKYGDEGLKDLSLNMKDLAQKLHELARIREEAEAKEEDDQK